MIDITRKLKPGIAVWTGDEPFQPRWTARIEEGSSVNIGALSLSTHTGTHVDAPLHYERDGATTDALPLSSFVGPAWVVDIGDAARITPAHVASVELARFPRVLFKTRSSDVPEDQWLPAFAAIDPETIDYLGAHGAVLLGTDAPSVDPADSTALPAHHALARNGIVNLENLALSEVEPGGYFLAALPLRLSGLDAAPVRAILMPLTGDLERLSQ